MSLSRITSAQAFLVFFECKRGNSKKYRANPVSYTHLDVYKRQVCAHELGHDQLHRSIAQENPIREFMLYDMRSKPEYEANIVASEILLDNDELLEYIYHYRYSAEQIARAMHTDINLVALKIAHLNELGYDLRPLEHRSNFLK